MTEQHDEALEELLGRHGRASFEPGFADRVMRRVDGEQGGPLTRIMPAEFLRLATAALLLVAALVTFNIASNSTDRARTTVEAMLGLQPLTADAVYDPSAIFFADRTTS